MDAGDVRINPKSCVWGAGCDRESDLGSSRWDGVFDDICNSSLKINLTQENI